MLKKITQLVLGLCFLITSSSVLSSGHLYGKSIDEVFKDDRVVNLINAAMQHDPEQLRQQISLGADVNAVGERGFTPLLWTMLNKDRKAVELLLNHGASANLYGRIPNGTDGVAPPVYMAATLGMTEMLKLLLEHGGDADSELNGNSALMQALRGPHFDCAELLLGHGADINFTDPDGTEFTAFHIALSYVQYDSVLWVLEHGYTHKMDQAQRLILRERRKTPPGQEAMKEKAIQYIADYLARHPASDPAK